MVVLTLWWSVQEGAFGRGTLPAPIGTSAPLWSGSPGARYEMP